MVVTPDDSEQGCLALKKKDRLAAVSPKSERKILSQNFIRV